MQIIPAIDLRGGRCVRLLQGDFHKQTTFEDTPAAYARRWEQEGAGRLHVVDLDGAKAGRPDAENARVIREIVDAVAIPVQVGGGIRSMVSARKMLDLGVDRVIVGTAITADPDVARGFFSELGARVVAGIDARDGLVAVDGWQRTVAERAPAFATRMSRLGAKRIVFTDIARDGMQQGLNLGALAEVANAAGVPVIASGGVGALADVVSIVEAAIPGVEGLIVGRALYSGSLSLADAIAATGAASSTADRGREA